MKKKKKILSIEILKHAQKLELIKQKAEVNNLIIETNLLQRTNEAHACTEKYIFLLEILQKL